MRKLRKLLVALSYLYLILVGIIGNLQDFYLTSNTGTHLTTPLVVSLPQSGGGLSPPNLSHGISPGHVVEDPVPGQAGRETELVKKLVEAKPDQHRCSAGQH